VRSDFLSPLEYISHFSFQLPLLPVYYLCKNLFAIIWARTLCHPQHISITSQPNEPYRSSCATKLSSVIQSAVVSIIATPSTPAELMANEGTQQRRRLFSLASPVRPTPLDVKQRGRRRQSNLPLVRVTGMIPVILVGAINLDPALGGENAHQHVSRRRERRSRKDFKSRKLIGT